MEFLPKRPKAGTKIHWYLKLAGDEKATVGHYLPLCGSMGAMIPPNDLTPMGYVPSHGVCANCLRAMKRIEGQLAEAQGRYTPKAKKGGYEKMLVALRVRVVQLCEQLDLADKNGEHDVQVIEEHEDARDLMEQKIRDLGATIEDLRYGNAELLQAAVRDRKAIDARDGMIDDLGRDLIRVKRSYQSVRENIVAALGPLVDEARRTMLAEQRRLMEDEEARISRKYSVSLPLKRRDEEGK